LTTRDEGAAYISKIKIVTDSTAYLSPDSINRYDLAVVPLTINLPGASILENENPDFHPFFQGLRDGQPLPTTSQPAVGLFAETFRSLSDDGSAVIAILISEKLSGTVQSARSAAAMLPDRDITVVDSTFTVSALRCFVVQAAEKAAAGETKEEILRHLDRMRSQTRLLFLVESLEYLRRGGRIGNASAFLGTILQVKPILHVSGGSIEPLAKVRTWERGIARIEEEIGQWLQGAKPEEVNVGFVHVDDPHGLDELRDYFSRQWPDFSYGIYPVGPVVGSHVGPGCIGVSLTRIK